MSGTLALSSFPGEAILVGTTIAFKPAIINPKRLDLVVLAPPGSITSSTPPTALQTLGAYRLNISPNDELTIGNVLIFLDGIDIQRDTSAYFGKFGIRAPGQPILRQKILLERLGGRGGRHPIDRSVLLAMKQNLHTINSLR